MTTFDQILPELIQIFQRHYQELHRLVPIIVNRDLNARVRLIVDPKWQEDPDAMVTLGNIASAMYDVLSPHAFTPENAILFEPNINSVLEQTPHFPLENEEDIVVIDRLASEGNWSSIASPSLGVPRIVFFSIKGGVGRSTALAAAAWALAESGKRLLVLDLDLESPGISSALLPEDRRPKYGITDWLVEDLVDNGDTIFQDMIATSALSHNGEIFIVPAHGGDPGEYIAKLGRVWMPKVGIEGWRETWSQRLRRLLDALESRWKPDVILIDSRAGIDEVASTCITDLSALAILLFAIDGEQTWSGYRILFRHWRSSGVVREMRDRLQLVGAMIPEIEGAAYFDGLRERAWNVFSEELYDEVPAGDVATGDEFWSFDKTDEGAPHHPWPIHWHRGFAALTSLHQRLLDIDPALVDQIFGSFINGLQNLVLGKGGDS